MVELNIEDYIRRELSSAEQKVAMSFICFLKDNHLSFCKDNGAYWKDKIYYWVKLDDECVCFVAIKDPDEKNNHWTVWSADMGMTIRDTHELDNADIWNSPDKHIPSRPSFYCLRITRIK